jgi:hypothetical protein
MGEGVQTIGVIEQSLSSEPIGELRDGGLPKENGGEDIAQDYEPIEG